MANLEEESAPRIGFAGAHWEVHKFGGTSVQNADCFRKVADICEQQESEQYLAIVVSAMGGKPKTTDLLLQAVEAAAQRDNETVNERLDHVKTKHYDCLQQLQLELTEQQRLKNNIQKDCNDIMDILKTVSLMKWQASRISELVSGYGEIWSAQILTSLLKRRSSHKTPPPSMDISERSIYAPIEYIYLDARRVITIDEDAIQNGTVAWQVSRDKLDQVYQQDCQGLERGVRVHFVITGYVASNLQGVATTLQRDGSDYSAAIMGRLLEAQKITIWTDVDGVLNADPRKVPLAQVIPEVSYNEAMELAYFGAKVIHPKTMQPALESPEIPIFIRNTFNKGFRGTRIYLSRAKSDSDDRVVTGFSTIPDMALVNVEGSGLVGVLGVVRRLFGVLEQNGVNVVLISQGSSEHSVTFATHESQAKAAKAAIHEEFRRELETRRLSSVDVVAPCSIIAAVGDNMAFRTGVSGKFFSALGEANINILAIAQGSSERNISAVVRSEQAARALRGVHAAFALSHTTIRVAICGVGTDLGLSLLQLLEEQRSSLRSTFEIDVQVVVLLEDGNSNDFVCLIKDKEGSADSLTVHSFRKTKDLQSSSTSFTDDVARLKEGNAVSMTNVLVHQDCPAHVIFDCTNDEKLGSCHAGWLMEGIHVVTANNTGLSGTLAQREDIVKGETRRGKHSAKYLPEVTVGGGLPIINTIQSLLHSGDKIRKLEGILSVSLSYILYRVSPPPGGALGKTEYQGGFPAEKTTTMGMNGSEVSSCSLSQAVKEAIELGFMEEDPTLDLNNEYTSRVLMVLAKQLGMDSGLEVSDIRSNSVNLLEFAGSETLDYQNISPAVDNIMQEKVKAATSRGCVLRHLCTVNVRDRSLSIQIAEIPAYSQLAVTPPSCECVRFFTQRHERYPLVIQGPSAGADSTASALLAELLHLMRGKTSPKPVRISRSGSGAVLGQNSNTMS